MAGGNLSPYLPRPLDWLRKPIAKLPAIVVWAGGLVGVWLLSHGGVMSPTLSKGFAEPIPCSVAPLRVGRVATVGVAVGQKVKAGDVIATMDSSELDARLEQTRAELHRLQADVTAQQLTQDSQAARGEIWVLKARADANRDRAELEVLTVELARLKKLAHAKLV